ncbi:hypothetical protein QJS10_CPB19g00782 [Acorus calamus]|uniref:Uncharacterized protein n=1 Tax=Acorus calamus TaxID=4465 RepID=A0AAV9CGR8_ACOCL|nr:hypothetical protein QJS10_CPB19g00782 [Acorus calamus]
MAFHVACPITCRRICHCKLGFPEKLRSDGGRTALLEEIARIEGFLSDPWCFRSSASATSTTVQVLVPRIAVPVPAPVPVVMVGGGDGEEVVSVQKRRAEMQRVAASASVAAEDYARRFEAGCVTEFTGEADGDLTGDDNGSATAKVMCRMCFSGENEGSTRAQKMLSCKSCNKKYHRDCLRSWAQYRDLFHWSSWNCPSCRICEVCHRVGDPNKFMFCKRCDAAYHCYCHQPPHKNVISGPFLCPKHTRCHSYGSNVSGSGFSTRWFLSYTCCDACGRLFVKGNYCPVCLKVYRDSESTPMVCCDVCQRWVHCQCDGISDEKYQQFQADGNLYYKCAACRGECYQVKDLTDAVQELWRRRDKADSHQIARLRAAAGLPSEEEVFAISPFSDEEGSGPVILKNVNGRCLKFSVKGLGDKSTKTGKEYVKKSSKNSLLNKKCGKKFYEVHLVGESEETNQSERQREQSLDSSFQGEKAEVLQPFKTEGPDMFVPSQVNMEESNDLPLSHSYMKDVAPDGKRSPIVVKLESNKKQKLDTKESSGKHETKTKIVKGTKLVIHLGSRNRNVSTSPKTEAPTYAVQDLASPSGIEDTGQLTPYVNEAYMHGANDGSTDIDNGKGDKYDKARLKGEGDLKKQGKSMLDIPEIDKNSSRRNVIGVPGPPEPSTTFKKFVSGKHGAEESAAIETFTEATIKEVVPLKMYSRNASRDGMQSPPASDTLLKHPKPLLKLKFKSPYFENQSSLVSGTEEEKSSVKGLRSKRKRSTSFVEKAVVGENKQSHHENPINEVMDAIWILQKLGKDAIGKRVEVHQSSDNTWHRGIVSDVIDGTLSLSIRLEDGRFKTVELEKQGIRFIPQKQKRSKMNS